MSILKYENFINMKKIIISIIVLTSGYVYADNSQAITALTKTYELGSSLSVEEAQEIVQSLNNVLDDIEDGYLSYRIKYRIGIINFKSNALNKSREQFMQIVDDSKSPENIKVLSYNMIGQISRMQGKSHDALDAFHQTINILRERLNNDKGILNDISLIKVYISAIISSAEIYELQFNYSESIDLYNQLLQMLKVNELKDFQNQYYGFVNDKVSQLYLREGETDKYMNSAKLIFKNSIQYIRTPVVKLEMACVNFLNARNKSIEFPNGSFEAPALLIASIKNTEDKIQFEKIVEVFDQLYEEYKNDNGGDLILYHYAWLLDTIGSKDKAYKIFSEILSHSNSSENNETEELKIKATIQEYAKIQYAIMAGEKGEYNEALKVLDTLREYSENSHLSELSKSVIESIETLKREVPVNEQ